MTNCYTFLFLFIVKLFSAAGTWLFNESIIFAQHKSPFNIDTKLKKTFLIIIFLTKPLAKSMISDFYNDECNVILPKTECLATENRSVAAWIPIIF